MNYNKYKTIGILFFHFLKNFNFSFMIFLEDYANVVSVKKILFMKFMKKDRNS